MRYLFISFITPAASLMAFFAYAQGLLPNPLGNIETIPDLIGNISKALIVLALPLAVIALIFVGFQFLMYSGNPAKLQGIKQQFMWVLAGTAVVVGASALAQALVNFIRNPEVNAPSLRQDSQVDLSPAPQSEVNAILPKVDIESILAAVRNKFGLDEVEAPLDRTVHGEIGITPEGDVILRSEERRIGAYDISEGPGAALLKKSCPRCLVLGGDISIEKAKELSDIISQTYKRLGGEYQGMDNFILIPANEKAQQELIKDIGKDALEEYVAMLIERQQRSPSSLIEELIKTTQSQLPDFVNHYKNSSFTFDDGSILFWETASHLSPTTSREEIQIGSHQDVLVHELAHALLDHKFGIKEPRPGETQRDVLLRHPTTLEWVDLFDKSFNLRGQSKAFPFTAGFGSAYGAKNPNEDLAETVVLATKESGYYSSIRDVSTYPPEFREPVEAVNKTIVEGNKIRYEKFQWLHKNGFIPKLPPPPPQ